MLAMAPRAAELTPASSRLPSPAPPSFKHAKVPTNSAKTSLNETANPVSSNGLLPFKAQCKSAVVLVNERRIDFVRAKNVRVIGRLDGNSSETKPKKKETKEITSNDSVERVLAWKHSKKIGPGFANLGNTCYLNSVLQCLTYTPCFAQFLLDKEVFASFNSGALPSTGNKFNKKFGKNGFSGNSGNAGGNGFCSVRAMSRLLQSVHGNNAVRVLQPKELVMNVRHISKSFRIGRQEDSHEFFRLLLDSMQRSCLRKAHIKSESHSAASTTFVYRMFGGKLKNHLKCAKCGFVSERFDDFLDLSLEISNGVHSVKGALRHFTAIEKLDERNAWKCSSCGKPSRAEKGLSIAECPNVLMIQLKRFDLMFGKIKRHIEFPRSLDIASGMSKNCEDRRRGRTKYELHAVLVHAGFSTDCGHYYAFVKGSSGQWYEMNDDSVRWVSLDTVLQQKAYMLFYSRVLPPSERPKSKAKEEEEVKAKAKEVVKAASQEEIPEKTAASKTVLAKTKELDMNGFLASLKTAVATDDKPMAVTPAHHQTVVTFKVKSKPSNDTPVVARPRIKRSLTPTFGGRVGRIHRFGSASWKSCPRLVMTQSVREFPEESTVASKTVATVAKTSGMTKVPFDPRQLKNVGVRNAALFGREVDKWTGETDVESSETTSSDVAVDSALAAKHDRVLNALKQEEWKQRNAGRQDYWDETLDIGKVKKVKKRKEFVANEGRKNAFQTALMRKKKDAKRQRTA
ncbi:ubiquitin-specific protease, putative [Phytophthora infestans T30-4]|uniref:Ubiquitin carboxyl-terminal hydrolase n=1 Tax=Phytophthora infestans (strain T30-4) TaxID=403677 RepID=D0NL37_PHYIT|nr:ubiquitin-specific protease, putative [Phytophthora infestans T30-4]EEY60355.1 ubiquitin-specific protease, putative [Phytophthora infestans T30-4]|eukprot:XP_002900151.1 ubiquitin-specific protease, putative [Phytophthora infestans T30-4]